MNISKFWLYENSVQNPHWQLSVLPKIHKRLLKKKIKDLREDFCGSGFLSAEWVKLAPENRAMGLDIDLEALGYAENFHRSLLSKQQQSRLVYKKQNVIKSTREKFDSIMVHNFSFFDFHERETLLQYAKSVYRSLKDQGSFFLETAGGSGFLKSSQEKFQKSLKHSDFGSVKLEWLWEHHEYDPITAVNDYSIHYCINGKHWINDVFHYHWRIWGIRELREVLMEAGFLETQVLWPLDLNSDEYQISEVGLNHDVWMCYVVGIKR